MFSLTSPHHFVPLSPSTRPILTSVHPLALHCSQKMLLRRTLTAASQLSSRSLAPASRAVTGLLSAASAAQVRSAPGHSLWQACRAAAPL